MQTFFGQRWDAPAFDEAREVPTPVGEVCLFCEEPVSAGDSGTHMAYVGAEGPGVRAVHIECFLRQSLGSLSHLTLRCSCYGGTEHEGHDRDSARQVKKWLEDHPGQAAARPPTP